MNNSARLDLPYLYPGQAQKELFLNEALQRLDVLVQAVVVSGPANEAPAQPIVGQTYVVGTEPTGEWAQHANSLAAFTAAGWIFVRPFDGLSALLANGQSIRFQSGAWSIGVVEASEIRLAGRAVLAGSRPNVAPPAGGATIDAEARATLRLVLDAMRGHGLIGG